GDRPRAQALRARLSPARGGLDGNQRRPRRGAARHAAGAASRHAATDRRSRIRAARAPPEPAMITLRDMTLRRGTKVVLEGASVTLQPGEKVGLVGRNGAGKSSLFALLTGHLHADAGDLDMPPRWRIAEVAQHMPETGEGATDFVLQGDTRLMEAQAQLAL